MIGMLDGGTTRTRLRVWDGVGVVFEASAEVGARDGAGAGQGGALLSAVRTLLEQAPRPLERVMASGMLSSPSGLVEIAHLRAPVSYAQLAAGLQTREVEGLGRVTFVPGVRTVGASVLDSDVMRGEETEVLGLRSLLDLRGPVNFLHLGSHDKLIWTDDRAVLRSVTNLNGELLAALSAHTLLRESTAALHQLGPVDPDWWRRGLEAAQAHGLSRAAFLVRLGGLFGGATRAQGSAFLLGALAEGNLRLFSAREAHIPAVLYGRSSTAEPTAAYLAQLGFHVRVLDEATSGLGAVVGAARLLDLSRQAGAGGVK